MADHITGQAQWHGEVARLGHHDKIIIRNLEITVNAGMDAWGRRKKQRALISVTLTLEKQFTSASTTDSVDNSTVHYGTLSKAIRERFQDESTAWISTLALSAMVRQCVRTIAGSTPLFAVETEVCYLKGSMFGDGAGYIASGMLEGPEIWSCVLYLRNMRVPCIIGVNSNERLQKQPVVVNVWIDDVPNGRADDHAALETFLFTRISESSYQTIESLLKWIVEELREKFFTRKEDQDAWIRLRIEKPLAVPFADAPAVEITRQVRGNL